MKKRWIGILLVAGLVSILGGCEKKEASDDTKAEATATPEAEEKESLETLDIEKYVKVGEYKGIALTEENISVSEEEIDAEIQERLSQNPLAVPGRNCGRREIWSIFPMWARWRELLSRAVQRRIRR